LAFHRSVAEPKPNQDIATINNGAEGKKGFLLERVHSSRKCIDVSSPHLHIQTSATYLIVRLIGRIDTFQSLWWRSCGGKASLQRKSVGSILVPKLFLNTN